MKNNVEEEESSEDEVDINNFGSKDFSKKKADLEFHKNNTINVVRINEGVSSVVDTFTKESSTIYENVKDALRPDFVNRVAFRKALPAKIAASEELVFGIQGRINDVIVEEKINYDSRVRVDKKIRRKVKKEKAHLHVNKTLVKTAKKVEVKQDFVAARNRLRQQALELKTAEDLKKIAENEVHEMEVEKLRHWRESYWENVKGSRYVEAKDNRKRHDDILLRQYNKSVTQTYDEWADREVSRTRMQSEAPILSEKIDFASGQTLGIFGVPMHPGSFARDGHVPGLDQGDVHVFSSAPQTEFENSSIHILELQADLARTQSLYDLLINDSKRLDSAMSRMCELRENHERDYTQLTNEITETSRSQLGPPRRMPSKDETLSTHERKTQQFHIKKMMDNLQHSIDVSNEKKLSIDAQLLSLAKDLSIKRNAVKSSEQISSTINGGLGMLPVVVGRNISKVMGNDITAQPLEMYNAITQQSKFTEYEKDSKLAIKIHKEGVVMDRSLWYARQSGNETKLEIERTLNKLSDITKRLKSSVTDMNKLNVVEALTAYFMTDTFFLNPIQTKIYGPICWFKNRNKRLCKSIEEFDCGVGSMGAISFDDDGQNDSAKHDNKNSIEVVQEKFVDINENIDENKASDDNSSIFSNGEKGGGDESDYSDEEEDEEEGDDFQEESKKTKVFGVSLKAGQNKGFCIGAVKMPKVGIWSIFLTICRRGHEQCHISPDGKDYISVQMGSDMKTLKPVGTFKNVINPMTGAVLYDVKYVLRGDTLCYRFDFSSSSLFGAEHMVVSAGMYEEYEMLPLEVLRIDTGRERVLSSYIRLIRAVDNNGKMRLVQLLEELLDVEHSDALIWDSKILQNYPQRYTREYFLRILRAEILVERKKQNERIKAEERGEIEKDPYEAMMEGRKAAVNLTESQYEKVQLSLAKNIKRKQEIQMPAVFAARELVGKRLDIYDPEQDRWRHVVVQNSNIRWIDGGVTARLTHILQEVNKYNENIGNIFEMDLKTVRYVLSATQIVDEQMLQRVKESSDIEIKIEEVTKKTQKDLKSDRKFFKQLIAKNKRRLFSIKTESENASASSLDSQLQEYLNAPETKRLLKKKSHDILVAINNGLIAKIPHATSAQQAEKVARERISSDWRDDQANLLQRQLAKEALEITKVIEVLLNDMRISQTNIHDLAFMEKRQLKLKLKKLKEEHMNSISQQLNIKGFDKAVIQPKLCEHVKAKAWGDCYGSGVRCLNCGKELTDLWKEESQLLGYGSGCDPAFNEALNRHRTNEVSFRFKDSAEIATMENERIRLEKERRIMNLEEVSFYDFQDIVAVYDFDRRHARDLKAQGVFRQGLQWKPEELKYFETTKRIQYESQLEKDGLFIDEEALKNFDALSHIENPPPTFRADDERHHAQYKEFVYAMGRLNTFNIRINELKRQRMDLLTDRKLYSEVLVSLHKESFTFEHTLTDLENDLERTSHMLYVYSYMVELYTKANKILLNAQRERKRCEMRKCGLWDDVKETREKLNILHEETRDLLKLKFVYDLDIDNYKTVLDDNIAKSKMYYDQWKVSEENSSALLYCRPGDVINCKYGQCKVIMYRHDDQMLMIELPFCNPPAKGWIQAWEIIRHDRNLQHAERLIMRIEDERMKKFDSTENAMMLKELYTMRNEELICRRRWELEDLQNAEEGIVQTRYEKILNAQYHVTQTPNFQLEVNKKVEKIMDIKIKANLEDSQKKLSLKKGKVKRFSAWKKHKMRLALDLELKKQSILRAAEKEKVIAKADIASERKQYLGEKLLEDIMSQTLVEIVYEIASESLKEGSNAKRASEILSGIYFPTPAYMQYTTYCLLRDIWKRRKRELSNSIQIGMGSKHKFESTLKSSDPEGEDSRREAEKKLLLEIELQRQTKLCKEMMLEEENCREFYHWELLENLRERRLMKEEENMMKAYNIELAKAELAAQSTYNVGTKKEEVKVPVVTAFERRRNELKELAIERRRNTEELEVMRREDAASKRLREIDKKERQARDLVKQLGLVKSEAEELLAQRDEEEQRKKISDSIKAASNVLPDPRNIIPPPLEVPDWMELPDNWTSMKYNNQKRHIEFCIRMKNYETQGKLKIAKEMKIRQIVCKKSFDEWKDRHNHLMITTWCNELNYMTSEDEKKENEYKLIKVTENSKKLLTYCQQKGEEELKMKMLLHNKEEFAKQKDKEYQNSVEWENLCAERAKQRSKFKRRVEADCLWADTDAINGFMQRFRTERLRARLYWSFFREIVASIIVRAEIITTERKLMSAQEGLSLNRFTLNIKTKLMKELWREYQRNELLRTKRSKLNEKFFPLNRKEVLRERFSSWVRFYYWNRGHKEAFQLKYEILKTKMDLERMFKKQLVDKKSNKDAIVENSDSSTFTAMQLHGIRPVQCQVCKLHYLESQNNSLSCKYHSGEFKIACPKSCTNPGLSPVCIAHKKQRWICCDVGDPNAIGCARRQHIPKDSDPVYDSVMKLVIERDRDEVEELDGKLVVAHKNNWISKSLDIKRTQVFNIVDDLELGRSKAAKFDQMKISQASVL